MYSFLLTFSVLYYTFFIQRTANSRAFKRFLQCFNKIPPILFRRASIKIRYFSGFQFVRSFVHVYSIAATNNNRIPSFVICSTFSKCHLYLLQTSLFIELAHFCYHIYFFSLQSSAPSKTPPPFSYSQCFTCLFFEMLHAN